MSAQYKFHYLTDSVLLSSIYLRRNAINKLNTELESLITKRKEAKSAFRAAAEAHFSPSSPHESCSFHQMYTIAREAAHVDEEADFVKKTMNKLSEEQFGAKKEYRRRVNEGRRKKKNAVISHKNKFNRQKAWREKEDDLGDYSGKAELTPFQKSIESIAKHFRIGA